MSIARHHSEWLSLVEASGPFLSLPVLMGAFPQGLDAHDPEHLRSVRAAHEQWEDNQQERRPDTAIHRAWTEFVLRETLRLPEGVLLQGQRVPADLSATAAEHGETLRPDWVVVNPADTVEAGRARLLIQIVPAGQGLDKPFAERHWKASPSTRMMELLHATGVRLGLVTNGHQWMLVNAPRNETTGFISSYANLWLEEHLTLRAFRSLLSVERFFGVEDERTLEALLEQSATDQQEVTDQLGYQVRKAVEVLVQELDRIDKDRNRALLADVGVTQLYEAALTVMMRLVFLLSAEEREPLLLGDELYDQYFTRSPSCVRSCARARISRAKKCWPDVPTPGAACWRRSAGCTAASSMSLCGCPRTAGIYSTRIAFPFSKAARRARVGATLPPTLCPLITRSCCTC